MKKYKILILVALFSFSKEIYAQKTTEIGFFFAPSRVFATLKSRDNTFDEYVIYRNQNEPRRGGVFLGFTIERPFLNNLKFRTGINLLFYGSSPSVRVATTDWHKLPNPDRVSVSERQENYFLTIPFHIRKDLFKLPINKTTKYMKSLNFKIYTIGGLEVGYMFNPVYLRTYELQSGEREITENEFENSFDVNSFNILVEAGLGFQWTANKKIALSIEPSFNYTLFSIYRTGITERFGAYSTKFRVGFILN